MGKGTSVTRTLTATVYQMRTTIVHSGRGDLQSTYIYKEYHSVCPLVGIGTLPTPLSPASVSLPPRTGGRGGGGAHSPAGEGLRDSQYRRLEKKLNTLPQCLLCAWGGLNGHGPLFVQRCNGTTAGLGYLEVGVDCSLGGWHVRTVNMDWGNGTIPRLILTSITITSIQLQNKQALSPLRVHTTTQPTSKHIKKKSTYQYQCVRNKIKSQIKALATKYFTYALKVTSGLN
jgi:hypothetical protein